MSAYQRVKHWATFAQTWHLYDAKWQNPFHSADLIIKYLKGFHKPIYSPTNLCGDHVVVINSRHIALPGIEWKKRVYFHHSTYAGGATWTLACDLHAKDPKMILWKAVYNQMAKNLQRRHTMQMLHIYPDAEVPEEILCNVTNQIRQLRPCPKALESYSKEEIETFPKIVDYPENYVVV